MVATIIYLLICNFQQKSNVTTWFTWKFGQEMEKRQLVQGGSAESKFSSIHLYPTSSWLFALKSWKCFKLHVVFVWEKPEISCRIIHFNENLKSEKNVVYLTTYLGWRLSFMSSRAMLSALKLHLFEKLSVH